MDKKHNHFLPDQSIISVNGLTEDSGEDLITKIKNTINNLFNKPAVGDDDSAGKLESEAVRNPKVRERISNIVRANLGKMPLISVHWIYV
jgi:hypothetical protein